MIELGVNGEGVDEKDFLTSRSCIIAQSGAGKSYGVAVICEQLAKLNLGFCIIDTEGEYFSLKQGFDILWVGGAKSDLDITHVDLRKLANRVVKDGVPLIFDVSDVDDERKFVNDFVTALYEVEEELRLPYLLVIEEADKFIPQRGEKLTILYDVARRGRKRGLGLLVASQRPALVDKEVLSQCNHQFIGKLTVENDIDSARYFFNLRKNLQSLPDLNPGEFFMSGFKPEEALFKFRERVTKHESVTPELLERVPARIKEVIDSLGVSEGLLTGVASSLSKEDAELIAFNNCKRRLVFIGDKEVVESVRFFYQPLLELSIKCLRKSFFGGTDFLNSFAYFTPEYRVVDDVFNVKFDLGFMKGLPVNSVKVLISLLYEHAKTLGDVTGRTGISELDARNTLKSLVDSGFITHSGWAGKYKVYQVVRKVSLPKVVSLCSERIEANASVSEDFKFSEDEFKQVVKSLDSKADVVGAKVIYYPFYKAVLRSGEVSRELLINAVTGRVL